jgi:uncharacterized membrane protein
MKNPIKYSFKTEIWPFLILLAMIVLSLWSYQKLPARVIRHWNFDGKADGWSSREFFILFFPGLSISLYVLFNIFPRFDPKSERYGAFSSAFLIMRDAVLLILLVTFAISIFINLGYKIDVGNTLTAAVSILIIVIGNYLGKVKPNWFIGIRTPCTLSSENVWNKTHRIGSRLFVIVGVCALIAVLLKPVIAIIIFIGGVGCSSFYVFVYSYILYKNEKKEYKS